MVSLISRAPIASLMVASILSFWPRLSLSDSEGSETSSSTWVM